MLSLYPCTYRHYHLKLLQDNISQFPPRDGLQALSTWSIVYTLAINYFFYVIHMIMGFYCPDNDFDLQAVKLFLANSSGILL